MPSLGEAQEELGRLMASLGEPMPEDPLWAVDRLKDLLDGAEERLARAEGAREGLAELAKMEEALEAEKETLEGKRKDLEDLITAVGEAVDFEEALQGAKLKQELLRARDGMLGQLRREHLDLAALARRIEETARDHPWMLDPEEVEACRLELENLEDERSNLKEELGSLTKEIERFRDKVSAGELEGQIQALDERIEA